MHHVLDRRIPLQEPKRAFRGSLSAWDAARVFLKAVRGASLPFAAERVDFSINMVRRPMVDFQRLIVATFNGDLHGAARSGEMVRHGLDAAPHRARPAMVELNLMRLGRMRWMLFASRQYIATYRARWKSCARIGLLSCSAPTPAMSSQASKTGSPVVQRGVIW